MQIIMEESPRAFTINQELGEQATQIILLSIKLPVMVA